MSAIENAESSGPNLPRRRLVVTATFTAEPLQDSLEFWMAKLNLPFAFAFAPYDQVFQQLLDPGSLLSRNSPGVNVVLIRLEDWLRSRAGSDDLEGLNEYLVQRAAELIVAVRSAMARSPVPLIVGLCPESPSVRGNEEVMPIFARLKDWIADELGLVSGLFLLRPYDFELYPVADYHDAQRDRLGHIPYTDLFFAALGTILARKIRALLCPPYKVIVVDCDNTLWKGVVGEEGVKGIAIPPAWKEMQNLLVNLVGRGFLLCLCSKNDEADVLDVFDKRSDMILRREHLVSWKINWQPKSQNIHDLAGELNVGLDSFVFLDDSPVECAEVRAGCPEVVTLQLPIDGDMTRFLEHVWAFDRLQVTTEDRQRTAMYRQEADRARLLKQAPTIEEFVAGLEICVRISEPAAEKVSRVAQLTQRTNQFNFVTRHRTEADIVALAESRQECRAVEVSDRFGDYGLVGVLIFGTRDKTLEVDTFLLSCRVLGRGVEHRMLGEIGRIAQERGASQVVVVCVPTKKNQPWRDFLENVAAEYRQETDRGLQYRIPADRAAAVIYTPESAQPGVDRTPEAAIHAKLDTAETTGGVSERFDQIAIALSSPQQVLEVLPARHGHIKSRASFKVPYVAPRTETEATLAEIWAGVLRLGSVGIRDRFFELGGTSILAVDLVAQVERRFDTTLPLTSLLEAPTIEQFAQLLASGAALERDTLIRIREGGDKPPIFLVHDGDGETLLYRNLALVLDPGHAVFGLQPLSRANIPMAHSRITEMAACHVDRIRAVQPHGPYLLGGMCAGGVIAFEIGRQLQDQGDHVEMIALIDAADVEATPKAWRFARERAQRFAASFHAEMPVPIIRRGATIVARALRKGRNLTIYMIRDRFERVRDEIRMRLFRYHLDRGLPLPRMLGQIPVRTVYLFAEKGYRPERRFDGELVLFRATSGQGADEPYIARYEDPSLGWGQPRDSGSRRLRYSRRSLEHAPSTQRWSTGPSDARVSGPKIGRRARD